ncbi:MAG: STAS domain-containing protein [Acidobacteria bacterium]|nr:STAS domain-containing protein [Acidobacteriota bacterium]
MSVCSARLEGQCGVVAIQGDFTALVVPEIGRELKDMVAKGARQLVFDLSDTYMLDSSGIGLLIAAANTVASHAGSVRVTNVSAEIFRLLQSMRLVNRLQVSPAE